jgi:hypothetical protein
MTQTSQAKQGKRELGQAGWILDYWVACLIAALARAIRHRRAKRPPDACRLADLHCSYASCCGAGGGSSS